MDTLTYPIYGKLAEKKYFKEEGRADLAHPNCIVIHISKRTVRSCFF